MLPTCLVGSYPQPDWLIDRALLSKQMPPRVNAAELWRIPVEFLEQAIVVIRILGDCFHVVANAVLPGRDLLDLLLGRFMPRSVWPGA